MIRSLPSVPPCTLVIFGAGGDLTRRKLVPSLYHLARDGLLPQNFALLGNAREPIDSKTFRERMKQALQEYIGETLERELAEKLVSRFYYFAGDSANPAVFTDLKKNIEQIEKECGTEGNAIFYLATPPRLFSRIPENLAKVQLLSEEPGHFRRIILEKPFGSDVESARKLNQELGRYLRETQIYRIDHYLGKETVQNIMAFRFANNTFEALWNQHYIDSVQITVAETEGIDGRGAYYDTAGALRDMVPNHLFQLVSLIGMEPPNSFDADEVSDEKLKVIKAIRPFTQEEALRSVVRGQYGHARGDRDDLPAYREEKDVNPQSETETFAALRLYIDNWRWAGIPFYLRTGKRLAEHETQIVIQLRHVPVQMFRDVVGGIIEPNLLTIQIFPREKISLSIAAKVPGTVFRLGGVDMSFDYEEAFGTQPKTGYETLIYDAITGDRTLFQRGDQVEAAWAVVTPILEAWETCQAPAFPNYPSGSWGPLESHALLARDGRFWRELEFRRRTAVPKRKAA